MTEVPNNLTFLSPASVLANKDFTYLIIAIPSGLLISEATFAINLLNAMGWTLCEFKIEEEIAGEI